MGEHPGSAKQKAVGKEHKSGHNLGPAAEYTLRTTSAVNAVQDVMKFNHNSQRLEEGVGKEKQKTVMCACCCDIDAMAFCF